MSSPYKKSRWNDDYSTTKHFNVCKLGKPTRLISNHFKIDLSKCIIYRYNVKIVNAEKGRKGKLLLAKMDKVWYEAYFDIMNQLVDLNCSPGQQFYDDTYQAKIMHAFDGSKSLYTYRRLRYNDFKTSLNYRFDQFEFNLRIFITFSKELNLDRFQENFGQGSENFGDLLQALETILKEGPISQGLPTERGVFPRFNEEEKINENDIRCLDVQGLRKKIVFGHSQTIQVMQKQLNLVVDRAAHAFYISETLDKAMISILSRSTNDNQRLNIGQILFSLAGNDMRKRQEYTAQLTTELKGIMIETTHLSYRRRYKVFEVTCEPIRQLTFKDRKSGVNRNVCEYYRTTYGLNLNGALPSINVGNEKNRVYLPFEVCRIMLNQKANKLRFQERQNLLHFSITNHQIENRFEFIKGKVNLINELGEEKMNNLMTLDPNPIQVDAVQLFNPKLNYKNVKNFQPNYGKWKMGGKELVKGANLMRNEWCAINLTEKLTLDEVDQFLQLMMVMSEKIGMRIEPPYNFNRERGNQNSFFCETKETLKQTMKEMIQSYSRSRSVNNKPKCILFFIGKQRGDQIYKNIKSESELIYGLITQCVTEQCVHKILNYFNNKKLPVGNLPFAGQQFEQFTERVPPFKENGEYILNTFLLKINTKLGGINCTVNSDHNEVSALKDDLLILGADVTHPNQKEFRYSICSLVASLDSDHFKYTGVVRIQERALEELIRKMDEMVLEVLTLFVRNKIESSQSSKNRSKISDQDNEAIYNLLPKHIIFYRDGISEGQYSDFKRIEINSMYKAFEEFSKLRGFQRPYAPKLTVILCMKRHTTRFMKPDNKDEDLNSYEAKMNRSRITSINQLSSPIDYLNLSEENRQVVDEDSQPIQSYNINPGTLINNEKVVKTDREFYLCSHNCSQGTIRSTHYDVLINDCNFEMNDLQRFTYDMCFLFGKGTKSVSMPTPVKYAHSAAYRARQHLIYSDENATSDQDEIDGRQMSGQQPSFQQPSFQQPGPSHLSQPPVFNPAFANFYPPPPLPLPGFMPPFPNFPFLPPPPNFHTTLPHLVGQFPRPTIQSPVHMPQPYIRQQRPSQPTKPAQSDNTKGDRNRNFQKKTKDKNEEVIVTEETQKKIQVKEDLKLSLYFL